MAERVLLISSNVAKSSNNNDDGDYNDNGVWRGESARRLCICNKHEAADKPSYGHLMKLSKGALVDKLSLYRTRHMTLMEMMQTLLIRSHSFFTINVVTNLPCFPII